MDSDTGAVVSTQPAPLRADEVHYDAVSHRLYVPGGEGYLGIYDTSDPNHVKQVEKVTTAAGAKTALLLPDLHRLFLAVSPGDTKAMAKVLTYEVKEYHPTSHRTQHVAGPSSGRVNYAKEMKRFA